MKPCRNGHRATRDAHGACRECKRITARRWLNKPGAKEIQRHWVIANREKRRESWRRWRKAHPEVYRAISKARKISKRVQASALTPFERKQIQMIYAQKPKGWDVHHIVPIEEGGKHHPDNLVMLPADVHVRIHKVMRENPRARLQ